MEQQEKRQEYFELSFDIDDSRIPVGELIMYLHNTEKLLKSINESLEPNQEYNNVELDVLALEKGSFTIAFAITKTIGSFAWGILAGVMANLLTNNITQKQKEFLSENEKAIKSLVNILNTIKNNSRIKKVFLIIESTDGEKEKITISRETLINTLMDYHEKYGQRVWRKKNVTIKVDSLWGRKILGQINDGEWITAEIEDVDFLKIIASQNNSLFMKDSINVDLECILKDDNGIIDYYYNITKVHNPLM